MTTPAAPTSPAGSTAGAAGGAAAGPRPGAGAGATGPGAPATKARGASSRMAALGMPLLVVGVVLLMVVPLPTVALDVLLAANLATAVVVLLVGISVNRVLDFSVFPALLLVLTLARLGLNVASTRLILGQGEAGKVIAAFGDVVIGGSVVVGLVVFLILVVIQFVVITSGAQRVAEVSARFTLDALPGKQMAIDADLNAGLIDDAEARRRRAEVGQEAEFYGAMDGAGKFVKGDAVAGLVIVAVNLLGGFAIGVLQQGLSVGEAAARYSLLSVGDGLVSQVPALLLSVASGVVVTRVAGEERDADDDDGGLGRDVLDQLGANPRPLQVGAVALGLFALLPGMPTLVFLLLAAALAVAASGASRRRDSRRDEKAALPGGGGPAALGAGGAAGRAPAGAGDTDDDLVAAARVEPLEAELAPDLLALLDPAGGDGLLDRVRALRRRVAEDLGVVVPPVRVREGALLPPSTYVLRLHGVEVARGTAPPGRSMVLGDTDGLPGQRTVDPVFGLPAVWVEDALADVLAAEGRTVVDRPSVVVTHLSEVVRSSAAELLSRADVATLVEAVGEVAPSVTEDIGPDGLSLAEVQRVLRDLLAERVPVRDLVRVLEAVTARARVDRSPEGLVESARRALGPAISTRAARDGRLPVVTLAPVLEAQLLESVQPGEAGTFLAVAPVVLEDVLGQLGATLRAAEEAGHRPVLLCVAPLRPALRRLVAPGRSDLQVLSYSELARSVTVEPVGVVDRGAAAMV